MKEYKGGVGAVLVGCDGQVELVLLPDNITIKCDGETEWTIPGINEIVVTCAAVIEWMAEKLLCLKQIIATCQIEESGKVVSVDLEAS